MIILFHSYLIISPNRTKRQEEITSLVKKFGIAEIDILKFTDITSLGINDVKSLIKFFSKRPFVGKYKLAIITGDLLTIEAQNALLKTLEEPPEYGLIVIEATQPDLLLPTILSRCKLITLKPEPETINISENEKFWTEILKSRLGERLFRTSVLTKDREATNNWLREQIIYIRSKLLSGDVNQKQLLYLTILKNLTSTRKQIAGNVSLKLAIDHLLISLPNNLKF